MKIEYCIFTIGLRGHLNRETWPGEPTAFETEDLAVVAICKRIEWDRPRNNDFKYTVLPIYGQP